MSEIVEYPEQMKSEGESDEAYQLFKEYARNPRMTLKALSDLQEDYVYSTIRKLSFSFKWRERRKEYQDAVMVAEDLAFAEQKRKIRMMTLDKVEESLNRIKLSQDIEDPITAIEFIKNLAEAIGALNENLATPSAQPELADDTANVAEKTPEEVAAEVYAIFDELQGEV